MNKQIGLVFGIVLIFSIISGIGYRIAQSQNHHLTNNSNDEKIIETKHKNVLEVSKIGSPQVAGEKVEENYIIGNTALSAEDLQEKFVIQLVGDVMLGRSVNGMIKRYKNPDWPFLEIKDYLSQGDILIGNLESPLIKNCPMISEGFIFCGEAQNVSGVKNAGFTALSIENNHMLNFGERGKAETKNTLEASGLSSIEKDSITEIKSNNKIIHLIAFDDTLPLGRKYIDANWSSAISQADSGADITIVFVHWGVEYSLLPSSRQIELAHQAIDSGADIVVGAHPHVVQTTEIYEGKLILYSLGNFVFDQMWSEETKNGMLAQVVIGVGNQITDVRMVPTYIKNWGQVTIREN